MNEFYKNLKALRKEQGISLDEIQERTKINKSILELIENGQFEKLNSTYLRLFIRAYCNEIGKNPDGVIDDLEKFIDYKSLPIEKIKSDKSISKKSSIDKPNKVVNNKRTAKNIRSDIIKGSILVVIFIFAIYIIRLINDKEIKNNLEQQTNQFIENGSITKDMLTNNYDILYESTFALEQVSPFTVRLATAERTWYSYQTDSLSLLEAIIPSGENHRYTFNQTMNILFRHTKSLNLYLNNFEINGLESSSTPILINISAIDNSVRIQRFVPKLN